MKAIYAVLVSAGMLTAASAAQAAQSDYFLKIDGVEGEATATIEVASWSFGVCNAGQCGAGSTKRTIVSPRDPASGQATGKRQHGAVRVTASQNTQSLRESPSKASDGKTSAPKAGWDLATGKGARTAGGGGGAGGQVNVASGDVDGDGLADLAFAATQDEISSLTLDFDKASPVLAKVCQGKHFATVTLSRSNGDSFEITDATATCAAPSAGKYLAGGGKAQGMACSDADCAGSDVRLTLTGGQMKHTRTGHVTLLK